MGMFDIIENIQVKCPRCGDEAPKSAQIKCGPQLLMQYEFGKDKIDIDWDYPYYGSIVDKDKNIISGIATCENCKKEFEEKFDELVQEAKDKKEIFVPEGANLLIECEINGEDALLVILHRLDDIYDGNRHIDSFDINIKIENNVAVSAENV